MDEEWSSPSPTSSFQASRVLSTNIADLNKKRKLPTEQLDLPDPKHKFWDHDCSPNTISTFDLKPEIIYMSTFQDKTVLGNSNVALQPESAKDSNSYSDDSDTATSIQSKARLLTDNAANKTSIAGEGLYDYPHCESEANMCEILEEQLLEFGSYIGYDLSENGTDCFREYADEDVEDTRKLNELNQDKYILSSGRWIFKQETQGDATQLTIDQEFEEYFSTLMM